jgi:hypothetical protein
MKRVTYVAVLGIAALLQLASSVNIRLHNGSTNVANHVAVSTTLVMKAGTHKTTDKVCSQAIVNTSASFADATQVDHSAKQSTSKLRVCNAVTTDRNAIISVWFNGEELTEKAMAQRECAEFTVPVSPDGNKFEVKLTGEVTADWSGQKSHDELKDIPVLFLVAHVFGQGASTTFSVDEFHGENNGLNAVQVAYMDVLRGASDAKLRLKSPGGEFELEGGTFISVCAGKYSVRFVRDGQSGDTVDNVQFNVGEQYIILRLASKNNNDAEAAMVFPDESVGQQSGSSISDYFAPTPAPEALFLRSSNP